MREISLLDFKNITKKWRYFCVDTSKLLNSRGITPIQLYYIGDRIRVITKYPELIQIDSGKSSLTIESIDKIIEYTNKSGKVFYKIDCGGMEYFGKSIIITRS